jgi:tRNA A-37 threonylcarbamoyl transferase component Bud32
MIITRSLPGLDDALVQKLLDEHEQAYTNGQQLNQRENQGVSECQINGLSYIIKAYQAKSPVAAFRILLGCSRVDTSFRFARILNNNGIAVARHLLTAKHMSLSDSRAFLVMEKAPGTALFEFIQPGIDLTLSETAIENIAFLVTNLHKLGIAHGDLHTRNLIIAEDDSVRLIDLDNAQKSTNGIRKDLDRIRKAVAITSNYEPAIVDAMKRAGHPLLQ